MVCQLQKKVCTSYSATHIRFGSDHTGIFERSTLKGLRGPKHFRVAESGSLFELEANIDLIVQSKERLENSLTVHSQIMSEPYHLNGVIWVHSNTKCTSLSTTS